MDGRRRYHSVDEDSARWDAVALRPGDVVVSSRSKHGTTWVQAVVLHLVHGAGPLPSRLPVLSPWVDHLVEPVGDLVARLEAQGHRRVLKTHTPLDGVPQVDGVRYLVPARHPLDAAVSLLHQGGNIDRDALARLGGTPSSTAPRRPRPEPGPWLARWVDDDPEPADALDSLPGVAHHLRDAWSRRDGPAEVHLVHHADLLADHAGEVRRLATLLDLEPAEDDVRAVTEATTFATMRERADERADELAPDAGVLRSRRAFFRGGRSGDGRALASPAVLERYAARAAELLPDDLSAWLHR